MTFHDIMLLAHSTIIYCRVYIHPGCSIAREYFTFRKKNFLTDTQFIDNLGSCVWSCGACCLKLNEHGISFHQSRHGNMVMLCIVAAMSMTKLLIHLHGHLYIVP